MLKVDDIFVNYGEFEALHGIALEVNQGEIVALLGGNGAGKTTTIRTLLDYRWVRDADGVLIAEVKADAFCHSMVRALVGACAAVGEGKLAVDDVVRLRGSLLRPCDASRKNRGTNRLRTGV